MSRRAGYPLPEGSEAVETVAHALVDHPAPVPTDRTTEIEQLGAHWDALRVDSRAYRARVERRRAGRPGGNRGRRVTEVWSALADALRRDIAKAEGTR